MIHMDVSFLMRTDRAFRAIPWRRAVFKRQLPGCGRTHIESIWAESVSSFAKAAAKTLLLRTELISISNWICSEAASRAVLFRRSPCPGHSAPTSQPQYDCRRGRVAVDLNEAGWRIVCIRLCLGRPARCCGLEVAGQIPDKDRSIQEQRDF